jgi:hypothetical protein
MRSGSGFPDSNEAAGAGRAVFIEVITNDAA